MQRERLMWSERVRPVLYQSRLDPHRIENLLGLGMPDVNYTHGWIELKAMAEWPKRDTTPLRVDHFSKEQRVWLRRRWRMKGNAWLLLEVGTKEFYLLTGEMAADHIGKITRADYPLYASAFSLNGFTYDPFVPVLTKQRA